MIFGHRPASKQDKKKAQLKKNRFNQEFFNFVRMRSLDAERVELLEESREKPKREEKEDKEIWSAKVEQIRNRLTGKKRESTDRWNRFAGTEGGGGRGR